MLKVAMAFDVWETLIKSIAEQVKVQQKSQKQINKRKNIKRGENNHNGITMSSKQMATPLCKTAFIISHI